MNHVEIEDFYHHDFTTVSEWEVFIARLEEIMHEWKLSHAKIASPLKSGDFLNCQWHETSEKINFADVEFLLKHYKLKKEDEEEDVTNPQEESEEEWIQCQKDALDISNDFVRLNDNCMEIVRYYGVREFLVLIPARKASLTDETRIKILLSSLTIATNNANCYIPALVQVQELWQKMYLGCCAGKGTCVNLDMVHLKKVPPHCKYLTGLLALFKQKIGEGCGVKLDSIMVSVRFSYLLKDWTNSTWTQEPPDFDFMQGETLGVAELGKLPFGATFDPVGELNLFTTWPEMSDNVVVDSEGYSDLEPQLAPEWSVQVKMVTLPACLLGEYMSDFLHLCNNEKTMVELLGENASYIYDDQMLSSAFNVLTESRIPTISTVVGRTNMKKNKNVEGPISEEILLPILYFLFPDADDTSKFPYNDITTYNVEDDQWKGVKTCTMDSLVWRLSVVAAHCTHNLGGATALAQLWHEFVQEIRFRWERSILIPGVGPGFPDSVRTCLLHQKLQMMNCCIARKKAREENAHRSLSMEIDDVEETESEEEEFFECSSEELANEEISSTRMQLKAKHLLWNKPTGRLAKHPSLRLIQTGDPLYLPVTQDPVPKTEDQLEEDAQVMMQLGTDKYASEMRARMMSASLLSDMESFKAANPGAVLEDFIRWYSPRDWIDEEGVDEWGQGKGHLSARMMIPDNPWSTTWASAQPVPAHRQKRLFDDTREAEKALHYLCSKRICQVAQLLLPCLTHAALHTLSSQKQEALPSLPDVAQSILNKLQFATKPIHQKLQLYEEITRDVESVEALVAQVNSLQHKLGGKDSKEFTSFLIQLMRGKEVSVPGGSRGDIGARITTMFRDAQKAAHMMTSLSNTNDATNAARDGRHKTFPEPSCKEFILRAIMPRPSPASTPQPQRLYACLKRDHIRLAGFFSEDSTFL
ncbi:rab3 GTPase-activating protein catalytic subunit [Nylanderia fulva]|uniref:rab3 GTPase-activating protein catalytic subunit n=1 Tax=Nylanderia fulva TaxID=613905 RepID=UPI0010FADE16|nr:rab3 GTPase-activating protein catalytic subunit [Nylanderia fulva]